MHTELEELFNAADKVRSKVGSATELPKDPGIYDLYTEDNRDFRLQARMRYLGYWPSWELDGAPISAESLRMYLEAHRLKLQVNEE